MLGKINFWAVAGIDDPGLERNDSTGLPGSSGSCGLQFLREGQRDRCAAMYFALDFGRPAVKLDNRFHQCQTQPGAVGAA
jgi:hypothetical protein